MRPFFGPVAQLVEHHLDMVVVDGSNPFGATINLGSLFFSAGSAFWLFFTFIAWAAQHLMQKLLRSFCSAHALCCAPPKLYAKLLQTLRYGAPRLALRYESKK